MTNHNCPKHGEEDCNIADHLRSVERHACTAKEERYPDKWKEITGELCEFHKRDVGECQKRSEQLGLFLAEYEKLCKDLNNEKDKVHI